MFNQVSYNVIIERFKAFAAGHLQLQRFSHGQITTSHLDVTPENLFPWMHVVPVNVQPVNGAHAFTFDVLFCELPRDKEQKEEYQREALSDCIRLAEDLLAEVRNGGVIFGEDVVLREGATIVPFMEEYSYVLTGVTLTITMEFPWDWSACDIPATWTSGGTGHGSGGGGGVGLVLRVNGTDNVVQTILDLVEGVGIEVEDLGDGRVRITNTGGGVAWGAITGLLSNQTDLQLVLDAKVNTGDLAAVATSGDYNDLINLPSQPGLQQVITTDANLYSNNTIAGNNTTMEFNTMGVFKVNGNNGAGVEVNAQITAPDTASLNATDTNIDKEASINVTPMEAALESVAPNGGKVVRVAVGLGEDVYIRTAGVDQSGVNNGDILTLMDKTTGEVEFQPPPTIGLTSVGLQVDAAIDAIVVAGSPLTSNGDMTIMSGGDASQYVDGNLQLQTMPTELPPTGAAGGDLAGTYPDPIVSHVHGVEMQSGAPTDGDTWVFNNTNNKWQHQQLHATQVDNDSAVTGTHVSDALNHLNTTKVQANAAITGGTATKITYDAKGLVTGGTAITAADLPSGIDATKIGTGVVSNTEFGYLDGVTSAIQTQINGLALPTLNVRGTAVAGVSVGSTTATSCNLSLALPSGTADRTYYIEAVWMLAPTFNPTGGGRVGFSWTGSIINFHGSFQGSASEISYRSVAATAIATGGLYPSNTPYFASDIARSAIAPTTFRGYLDVVAGSTTTLTLVLAAVTATATITFYPRGSYLRAIRVT